MPGVMPYVFEMTPSQAALNIARNQLLSKTFNFTGLFKTIIGIGGSVRYERQHETYRQFLQQQVFIAGQGKGNSEFGWDFSALPGDKWVSQGAYTAYGVLAVPKFRRSVKFSTDGSWLLNAKEGGRPQKVSSSAQGSQPNVKHEVFLPSRQDYWIEAMYYDPVPAGEEISVILQGKGFSSETSVLVNNTPLDPRWRLIDPNTSEFSYLPDGERGDGVLPQSGGQKKVHGAFELMSSETIAMRFRLPGFAGIPQITLLSPHRSVHVTDLPIRVNNSFGVRLEDHRKKYEAGKSREHVFFKPESGWLSIADSTFLRFDDPNKKVDARLRLVGIDLSAISEGNCIIAQPTVEVLDAANTFNPVVSGVHFDAEEGLLWLRDAPAHEGFLTIRVTPSCKTSPVLIDRVSVPLRPRISSLSVKNGPKAGKTTVEISGANFAHVAKVFFGEKETPILSRTDTAIAVRSPGGAAGEKVKVRVVSALERDGMPLSSAETNQEFQYDADKAPTPKALIARLAFTPPPGAEPVPPTVSFVATLDVDLSQSSVRYTFKAFNGTAWVDVPADRIGQTSDFRLTGAPAYRGTVTLQLWSTAAASAPLYEREFDVPFQPTLVAATYPATPGAAVTLRGTNLKLVTLVQLGKEKAIPVSQSYDQLTFVVPAGSGLTAISVSTDSQTAGGANLQY